MNLKITSSTLASHRCLVLLMGAIALVASCLPLSQDSDDLLFQAYMQFLPATTTTSRTLIVSLDDLVTDVGGSIPHAQLAKLIAKLKKAKVAATGVLVPLVPQQAADNVRRLEGLIAASKPASRGSLNKALDLVNGDERLVHTIKAAKHVVLPVAYLPTDEPARWLPERLQPVKMNIETTDKLKSFLQLLSKSPQPLIETRHFPANMFMASAESLGVVTQDSASLISPLLLATDTGLYPSYVMKLAGFAITRKKSKYYGITDTGVQIGSQFIRTGIDYRLFPRPTMLPADNELIFTAGDILNGRIHMNKFRMKIVLLGLLESQQPQINGTMGSLGKDYISNLARTLNALLGQRFYQQSEWLYGIQRAVIVMVLICLLLLPPKLRGLIGSGISLILALLILNISLVFLVTKNIWMPLTIPVWLLLGSALILPLRHRIANAIMLLKFETTRAYRDLAQNYQSQGQLDQALDYLSRCPVDTFTAEPLYNLGIDFERRRQFSKALSIYNRISNTMPGYRDIQERSGKLSVMPECFSTSSKNASFSGTATVILDDSMIAQPIIGRYQIERELGRGAMGMVYLGIDPKISRTVAIKTMALADEFSDVQLDDVKQRFYREAETAGQLSHPNIVTIYDIGEEHDLAYIAMDYIEGKSLDFYTDTNDLLPLDEVFNIGVRIADALDYAHERKVVHRDVKPANIIYNRENHIVKVMDFGIACLTDNSKTRTGTVLGSPFYMSPEQIAGKRVDGRSDLFSLGVTLYQLFTGKLPFGGDSMAALMYQIGNHKPLSIRKIRSDLPVCLVRIINQALEKNVEKRFLTGQLMADALYSCAERQGLVGSMRAR